MLAPLELSPALRLWMLVCPASCMVRPQNQAGLQQGMLHERLNIKMALVIERERQCVQGVCDKKSAVQSSRSRTVYLARLQGHQTSGLSGAWGRGTGL